jgi:hypothetical protein
MRAHGAGLAEPTPAIGCILRQFAAIRGGFHCPSFTMLDDPFLWSSEMSKMPFLRVGLLLAPVIAGHPLPESGAGAIDYTIQVENTMGHDMDFFYSDTDSTEHSLGTIPPYLKQKFVIKSPARTTIVIIERGAAMGDYEMKKTLELVADSVVTVAF